MNCDEFLYLLNFITGSNGRTDKVKNDAYICAIILSIVRLIASLSVSKWSKSHRRRSVYFTSAGLTVIIHWDQYLLYQKVSKYILPPSKLELNNYSYLGMTLVKVEELSAIG